MSDLSSLLSGDIRRALQSARLPGVDIGEDGACGGVVRVRSSSFVPDGLSLAGHPGVANALCGIADYPTFAVTLALPDGELAGVAALAAWGDALRDLAHDIRVRCEEVEAQVAPLRLAMTEEAAKPWHIISADPYKQSVTLSSGTLTVSDAGRTGEIDDLRTLFLRPFLKGRPGAKARFLATLESTARGTHEMTVNVGRRQKTRYRIDLLTGKVSPAPARLRHPDE